MVDVVAQTQRLTREQIAQIVGKNPRAVKVLENLTADVGDTLTVAVNAASAAAAAAQTAANAAQADATTALANAATALANAATALAQIAAHVALTAAHGTSGAVVGDTDTQTLTNKTLGSPAKLTAQTVGTGTATPTLSGNKPGANTGVSTWLSVDVNGSTYYLPLWT